MPKARHGNFSWLIAKLGLLVIALISYPFLQPTVRLLQLQSLSHFCLTTCQARAGFSLQYINSPILTSGTLLTEEHKLLELSVWCILHLSVELWWQTWMHCVFFIFQFAKVDALRFAFCTLQVRNRAKVDVGCGQIEGGGIIAVRATKLRPPANLPQHILLK